MCSNVESQLLCMQKCCNQCFAAEAEGKGWQADRDTSYQLSRQVSSAAETDRLSSTTAVSSQGEEVFTHVSQEVCCDLMIVVQLWPAVH